MAKATSPSDFSISVTCLSENVNKAKHTRPGNHKPVFTDNEPEDNVTQSGSMKQWNKPFLCKRTRYSEHFRLE